MLNNLSSTENSSTIPLSVKSDSSQQIIANLLNFMKPGSSTNPEQPKPPLVVPEAKPVVKGADDILALIVIL